jgi:hypothetical protein
VRWSFLDKFVKLAVLRPCPQTQVYHDHLATVRGVSVLALSVAKCQVGIFGAVVSNIVGQVLPRYAK